MKNIRNEFKRKYMKISWESKTNSENSSHNKNLPIEERRGEMFEIFYFLQLMHQLYASQRAASPTST